MMTTFFSQKTMLFTLNIFPLLNPLMTDPLYLVCMAKISILKKEGIIEKNS